MTAAVVALVLVMMSPMVLPVPEAVKPVAVPEVTEAVHVKLVPPLVDVIAYAVDCLVQIVSAGGLVTLSMGVIVMVILLAMVLHGAGNAVVACSVSVTCPAAISAADGV